MQNTGSKATMVKTCIVRKEVVWVLETYENDLIALGDQLREKRKTANLSQDRLGDIVNISGRDSILNALRRELEIGECEKN